MKRPSTWILTEGLAGTEAPCRGLAAALGVEPTIKRVRVRRPWDWLPARAWPSPLDAPTPDSDDLAPPWPELMISSGNVAAPLAVAIKRRHPAMRLVHVQNPKMRLEEFDLVIAPRHDGIDGPNVVVTAATLHGLTPDRLAAAARDWSATLGRLPRPLVAVLVGGPNRRFRFAAEDAETLASQLIALSLSCGVALTASRRTGAANVEILRQRLAPCGAYMWDGTAPNPYFGMLALADAIIVTQDSVSMISEALATAKPVYWWPMRGRSTRLQRFVDALTRDGLLRRFEGRIETWRYEPPDDTARAAAEIRRRFGW